MAAIQSELFIPQQSTTVPPSEFEQLSLSSDAQLMAAIAKLRSQNMPRYRPSRAMAESLPRISTSRIGMGPYNRRQRVQSPRIRDLGGQASRPNSASRSKHASSPLFKNHTVGQSKETQIGSGAPRLQRRVKAMGKSKRTSVANADAGVSQKIVKFEMLANQAELSSPVESSDSTEDVADVSESASLPVEEIFTPRKPGINKSEELPQRPVSILKTPTELYHGEIQPATEDETDSFADSGTTDAEESELLPFSTFRPIPDKLVQERDVNVTALPLRSGSVLTVIRPEQTAWQRFVYVQGPIRLPDPSISARKGSIASMYAFQDAVEGSWQQRSSFSRRSSDANTIDDIIDFFEDLDIKLEFHESDLSSIKCRAFNVKHVYEATDMPAGQANVHRAPSAASSSIDSRGESAPRLQLDDAKKRDRTLRDSTSLGSPVHLKRFNSMSKKKPYKRNALNRLTSII